MANLRQIKTQIKSIKSTAKVTKALQMVAATKVKNTQSRAEQFKFYADGIQNIIHNLGDLSKLGEVELARESKEVKNITILLIATSRGFTGALNSNLTLELNRTIKTLKSKYGENVIIQGVSIYKYGLKIFNKLGIKVLAHFGELGEKATTYDLIPVFEIIEKSFLSNESDEVYVLFPKFVNALVQKPTLERLLPISISSLNEKKDENRKDGMSSEDKGNNTEENKSAEIIFEPSKSEILGNLIREYFQSMIFNSLLQTIASEFSARFVAMKSATDNANKLVKSLSLKYNRIRQEKITNEMLDVVGGTVV
ncbi:MAG: ATP synthase F1 subunit gamma [bacterium]